MNFTRVLRSAFRAALALLPVLATTVPVRAQAFDAHASAAMRDDFDAAADDVRAGRSHILIGAAAGLVVGAGATWLITNSGGSTSLCDRDRNQDALSSTECFGLVALGGAVGAGIGALIGHLLYRDDAARGLRQTRPLRASPLPGRRPGLLLEVVLRPWARLP